MEENKKYRLTTESNLLCFGKKLYRIEALKDFGDIRKGEKGGFVESEDNLSQEGNCWIADDAMVYDDAKVSENAVVYDNVRVLKRASVYGCACVYNNVSVSDNAQVYGNAIVYGYANVCDDSSVFGNAQVYGNAYICRNSKVYDNACVSDNAWIDSDAQVHGNSKVCGDVTVFNTANVNGNVYMDGNTIVGGNAVIRSNRDYIVFQNWWSRGEYFTWTRSNNMWRAGDFYGTGEELIQKAYQESNENGREYERIVKYVEEILKEEQYYGRE